MIRALGAPSPQGRQLLMNALRGYQNTYNDICRLLHAEGINRDSNMARGLVHVANIAYFRLMACSSVLAAWRRLPVELWDRIFASYMDDFKIRAEGRINPDVKQAQKQVRQEPDIHQETHSDSEEMESGQDTTTPAPSLPQGIRADFEAMDFPGSLQAVCHAWRTAVLSSPSIWSQIAVLLQLRGTAIGWIPFVSSVDADRFLFRLQRIGARTCPWSLSIAEAETTPHAPTPNDLPLSSVLTQANTPWHAMKSLKLVVHSEFYPYLQQLTLPSMTSLVVVCHKSESYTLTLRLSHAPSLRKAVILNGVCLAGEQIPREFPWSQLTHLLFGTRLNGCHIWGLLRHCNSLRHALFLVTGTTFGLYISNDTPIWCRRQSGQIVTLHSLEALDIINTHGVDDFLKEPLVDIEFPALTSLRMFSVYTSGARLTSYLRSFTSLTRLTLVVSWQVAYYRGENGRYSIGDILDACPLLVELVATPEEALGPFFESLAFADDQPRGRHLRTMVILCDCAWEIRRLLSNSFKSPGEDVESILLGVRNLTASRRRLSTFAVPAILERLIIRLTDLGYPSYTSEPVVEGEPARQHLKRRIETTLQPFVDEGLQLSVEILRRNLKGFKPFPSGKHWGEGALDFIDEHWEYTASMPPGQS
ncbi:hypothetical protein NMY22_g6789 [Coprinellus aureogranulatus]|nr:hypothetical protein NMY22_g6789 [Coprinellus aureogranulatus]